MGSACKEAHPVTEKTYFDEREHFNENLNPGNSFNNLKSKIKLEFTIENIEINKRYNIMVKFSDDQKPFYTETVTSHMPLITFNTCYIGDYFFEKQQLLSVYLIKEGSQDGMIGISLGSIVGSPGSNFRGFFNDKVNISITAQGLSDSKSYIIIKLKAKSSSSYDFTNPKNKIHYLISAQGRKIYSSESIDHVGKFREKKIPGILLEKGFTIQFFDGFQEFITSKNDTIQNFCIPKKETYFQVCTKQGILSIINKSIFNQNVTFLDYIKAGVRIKLSIGIDYTGSNLHPNDPKSLHYLGPNMNDYEQAIQACGMIVAYYDYNQKFPTYGFGALLNGEPQVNFCFNINMKGDPEIYTIDNVLKEYRKSFNFLQLAGPTNFSPLVQRVVNNIKSENNPLKYHILLILTDGVIYDKQETIDALVEGSFLPLSVIIIGIGNDHFQEMIELDGDDNPITNSRGVKRMRDLVQFVPFNRYRGNPNILAEQVLEEVPRQIIEYYTMNNIYPNNINTVSQINTQSRFMNNASQSSYSNTNNNNNNNNYNPNMMSQANQYRTLNIYNNGDDSF